MSEQKDTKVVEMPDPGKQAVENSLAELKRQLDERINQVASSDPICNDLNGQIKGLRQALDLMEPPKK